VDRWGAVFWRSSANGGLVQLIALNTEFTAKTRHPFCSGANELLRQPVAPRGGSHADGRAC
jgi:hypothetical protein